VPHIPGRLHGPDAAPFPPGQLPMRPNPFRVLRGAAQPWTSFGRHNRDRPAPRVPLTVITGRPRPLSPPPSGRPGASLLPRATGESALGRGAAPSFLVNPLKTQPPGKKNKKKKNGRPGSRPGFRVRAGPGFSPTRGRTGGPVPSPPVCPPRGQPQPILLPDVAPWHPRGPPPLQKFSPARSVTVFSFACFP